MRMTEWGIVLGSALMALSGAAAEAAFNTSKTAAELEKTGREAAFAAGLRDPESAGETLSRRMDGAGVSLFSEADADALRLESFNRLKPPGGFDYPRTEPATLAMKASKAAWERPHSSRSDRNDPAVSFMGVGFGAAAGFLFGSAMGGLLGGLIGAVIVAAIVAVICG